MSEVSVNVYSQPGCMPCMATKRWLDKHCIAYNDMDAREHVAYLKDELGYSSTPVVTVAEDGVIKSHWSGHRPEKLHALEATPPPLVEMGYDREVVPAL